ncbi:MAG TPA: type VI secretion system-associated protein TagF [Luteibacter sp.]|uniref:type VI secretion system-associated protein TagF n=1 Tax=Luteibacter sp. TaxID=1886636 RepID=UPI002BFD363C|nr:type VI secretion system-associated protein TagF [Luteibacter sp.]HVI55663.1 type VI secretion system-associated protein TagF [Luteibacter sp.]
MMRTPSVIPSYFGKVPSTDDFISSPGSDHRLVRRLDRWLAECMARLAEFPGWQAAYDATGPLDILAAATASDSVVAASCRPSQDRAGRRFPLLACLRVRSRTPISFAASAPASLATLWSRLQHDLAQLHSVDDAGPSLRAMSMSAVSLAGGAGHTEKALDEYVATESVADLDQLIAAAGHYTQVLHVLAALHPLLRAVAAQPDASIHRGLILPLPADPLRRPRVAAFWMTQVATYLAARDVEVVALLATTPTPRLVLSLDGTRGTELTAAVHADWVRDAYIDLTDAPPPSHEQLPSRMPVSPHVPLSRLSDAFLSAHRKNS